MIASNNFKYAEIISGGLFHSKNGNCYLQDLEAVNINQFEGKAETHISVFRFSRDILDYYKSKKTISDYSGLIHTGEYLISDFDCSENIEIAKQDVITFMKYIQGFLQFPNQLENIPIYFTGGKGFNVYLPISLIGTIEPATNLHLRVKYFYKTLIENIYNETDYLITTLDFQIYSKTHLIRVPNTLNTKTNLFKIPLYFSELINLDISEIKELAKEVRKIDYSFNSLKENFELRKIFYQDLNRLDKQQETKQINGGGGLNLEPVSKGNRNKTLLINANRLRYKNIPINEAKQILKLWNATLPEPLSEAEFNRTVESAYRYETREPIRTIDRSSFYNFEDRKKSYEVMLNDLEAKTVKTGFSLIDYKTRGIRAGEICLLTSITGLGKSTIVQNIAMNYCKNNPNKTALYFSLEMGAEEIFEREIQISENIAGYEVKHSLNKKGLNNFIVVTEPITADLIPKYLDSCNEYFSETGFFIIDHSGLIAGAGTDEYIIISNAIRTIKQIAMKYKIPALVVSQINRMTALKKDERISLFSAKSSGELENSSSIVLALEKITTENYKIFGYDNDLLNDEIIKDYETRGINLLCLSILKNRRGGNCQAILEMDRKSLRIIESKEFNSALDVINEKIF